jgi:FkbH-like protein
MIEPYLDPTSLFWLPSAGDGWSADLREASISDPSGRRLRGLASTRLNISRLRQLKSALSTRIGANAWSALRDLRVGLVGSGTLDFLADALPGTGPRFGMRLVVTTGHYDAVQSIAYGADGLDGELDVVVVVLDARSFRSPDRLLDREAHDAAVEAAAQQIRRMATALRERHRCPVVLSNIVVPPEEIASSADVTILGTRARFIDDLNSAIMRIVRDERLVVWNLDAISSIVGRRAWKDPISSHVAKSPFAISLAPFIADKLCATLASLFGKARRGLILDLDNTLWGGVIGDDGLHGIKIGQGDADGEAYLAVQRLALELRRRGVALCVCSKNDDQRARAPFREHPDMLLREEHIAVFVANWNDKATNIARISGELNLGLDAFVFLDDNPAERARVRQELPEVAVPELPDEPALYASCLASGGYFETTGLTPEDLLRADAYRADAERAEKVKAVGNYEGYLTSLDMVLSIAKFDPIGRARVVQLINKSNQFNLTTRRRQEGEIEAIETSTTHIGLQFRLADAFGDNGMISVVILELVEDAARIDTWLMSCRVLNRGVEHAVLNEIVRRAIEAGAARIIGEYIPTDRNQLVKDHYPKLGFSSLESEATEGRSVWALDCATFVRREVFMKTIAL